MPIDPLKPYGIDEPAEAPLARPWYTHWWGIFLIIIFGIIMIGGAFFSWRVWNYYQKVQSGEIAPAVFQFHDQFTAYGTVDGETVVIPFFDVITRDDPQTGPQDADITIVEFGDFMCPHCADSALSVRTITAEYPNRVRYIFRDFPIEDLHPGSTQIHIAGECAKEQGKFWPFHDKVFQNQESITAENISAYVAQVGINIKDFDECIASGRYDNEVARDVSDGREAGVYGTPTFFFNGRKIEGAVPYEVLKQMVDIVLSSTEE